MCESMMLGMDRVYQAIQHEWSWRTERIFGKAKPLTADLLMPISCYVVATVPDHYRVTGGSTASKTKPYDVNNCVLVLSLLR